MKTPQLIEITTAAPASMISFGRTSIPRSEPRGTRISHSPTETKKDQSTRWASSSSAPARSTSGQKAGNSPQSPYAPRP